MRCGCHCGGSNRRTSRSTMGEGRVLIGAVHGVLDGEGDGVLWFRRKMGTLEPLVVVPFGRIASFSVNAVVVVGLDGPLELVAVSFPSFLSLEAAVDGFDGPIKGSKD